MSRFFARNIDWRGRLARGLGGLAMMGGAVFIHADWPWPALILGITGMFGLFEALRGWCLLRACGMNTRL
jgi:hypothetical protein